jgi:hypothetical protein
VAPGKRRAKFLRDARQGLRAARPPWDVNRSPQNSNSERPAPHSNLPRLSIDGGTSTSLIMAPILLPDSNSCQSGKVFGRLERWIAPSRRDISECESRWGHRDSPHDQSPNPFGTLVSQSLSVPTTAGYRVIPVAAASVTRQQYWMIFHLTVLGDDLLNSSLQVMNLQNQEVKREISHQDHF